MLRYVPNPRVVLSNEGDVTFENEPDINQTATKVFLWSRRANQTSEWGPEPPCNGFFKIMLC